MKSEDCHSRRVTNYLKARGQIAPSAKISPWNSIYCLKNNSFEHLGCADLQTVLLAEVFHLILVQTKELSCFDLHPSRTFKRCPQQLILITRDFLFKVNCGIREFRLRGIDRIRNRYLKARVLIENMRRQMRGGDRLEIGRASC